MKVYEAIRNVATLMGREGIGKGRKNSQQGYNFRGIDDVLNALSSALNESGLVILPRVIERTVTERETKNGGALFYVCVKVEFDLVASEDGSKHTVVTYGEAMDSADKATNKAMSAAYKYLALLTFCIPTESSADTDADFTTHDVAARRAADDRRTQWLIDRKAAIADAKTVGELKAIMDAALAKVRENSDQDAEDQLIETSAAKVAKAKKPGNAHKHDDADMNEGLREVNN
jgi:hypothetical protein